MMGVANLDRRDKQVRDRSFRRANESSKIEVGMVVGDG